MIERLFTANELVLFGRLSHISEAHLQEKTHMWKYKP